jgi:hypothetical protein
MQALMGKNNLTRSRQENIDDILRQHAILEAEAEAVRENDRSIIRGLFGNFYDKQLGIGIGFQRAWGSILSGDYFELFKIPGDAYLFVFADISGHGLPAYTSLVRLRSAITLSNHEFHERVAAGAPVDTDFFIKDIALKFTAVMDAAGSHDFASVIFTVIKNEGDKYILKFYNRGMFFPMVVRKFVNHVENVYDLNVGEKGWFPVKGHLLSPDINRLNPEKYLQFPTCEFIVYEGDCVLFFSDGIIEATALAEEKKEYGIERLKSRLTGNLHLPPQAIVNTIFDDVYEYLGTPDRQLDDMTAVLIDFPVVRA